VHRLLIGLAVLAVLLVGIDRAAELAVGWVVGERIAEQIQVERRPDVDFRGFPFLTQAAAREFGRVDVDMHGVRSQGVRMARLSAQLVRVRLLSGNRVSAEEVTGRGLVTYPDLAEVAGERAQVAYGGNGLVKVTRDVDVLGFQGSLTAFGHATVSDGVLFVRPERFETGVGPVDQVVGRMPLRAFDTRVPLSGLPDGIVVDLQPGPGGIALRFHGKDLLFEP